MDTEAIVQALVQENIFNPSQKADLIQIFEGLSKEDIIQEVLLEKSPHDHEAYMEKLSVNKKVREAFRPILHYWIIRKNLSENLLGQITDKNKIEIINTKIQSHKQSIRSLIIAVSEDTLSQGDLQFILEQLKPIQYIFQELNAIKDIIQIQKQDLDQIEKSKEYIESLKESIKSMPSSIIDYELKELEIELGSKFLELMNDPPLNLQQRQIIKKIKLTGQGKIAQKEILQGNDIIRNLKILRKSVCGIDIDEINRLLRMGNQIKEDCFKQLPSNMKKKAILLFGLSKAGKTTLITRALGYKMKKIQINGIYTIQPESSSNMNPKHKDLIIGYSNKSTTRFANIVQIPSSSLTKGMLKDRNSKYYLMDSAGLEDTAGSEVEITNRISLLQFIKDVDKLSIAIVINERNWGACGQDIIKLALNTSKIIRDMEETRKSITFVFNNFSQDFKQTFHKNVDDLYSNVIEQGQIPMTDGFRIFFEELLSQSKDLENMLVVDPTSMSPQQFIGQIWDESVSIQKTSYCFMGDIGKQSREQIQKLCKRCQEEFKKNLYENNTSGALYYIKLLKLIEELPRIQTGAALDIMNLEDETLFNIEKDKKKMKLEFEQFDLSFITNKDARMTKLTQLSTAYSKLKAQVYDFLEIFSNEKMKSEFQELLPEIMMSLKSKLQKWVSPLCDIISLTHASINAIDFFNIFGNTEQEESIKKELNQFRITQKEFMLEKFKEKRKDHGIKHNFECFETLSKILEIDKNNQIEAISLEIQEEFEKLTNRIEIVDLKNLQRKDLLHEIHKIADLGSEKQNLEKLLEFIEIVSTYPQQLINRIMPAADAIKQIVIFRLPNILMKGLSRIFESFQEEESDDENEDKDQMIENHLEMTKDKVEYLKMLQKIQRIEEQNNGKIGELFERLSTFLENMMSRLNRICEALLRNDEQEIKEQLGRIKKQIRKLQKIVLVTQSDQLSIDFINLKSQLGESITLYIQANTIDEKIKLRDLGTVRRLIEQKSRLHKIKPLTNILKKDTNFGFNFSKTIDSLMDKILEPVEQLKKQITTIKQFRPSSINEIVNFMNFINEELRPVCQIEQRKKISSLQKQLSDELYKLFEQTIRGPVQNLQQMLQKMALVIPSNEDFQKFMEEQDLNSIEKFKKPVNFLFQINYKYKLGQNILQTAQEIENCLKDSLSELKTSIQLNLEENQLELNKINLLKKAVLLIKNLEIKSHFGQGNGLEDTYIKLRNEYSKIAAQHLSNLQRFLGIGNEPEDFDETDFAKNYAISLTDKTQFGLRSRKKLEEHALGFKKNIERRLRDYKLQISYEENIQRIIIKKMLNITNKYLRVQAKLKEFQKTLKIGIHNLDEYLDYAAIKLIEFYTIDSDIVNMPEKKMNDLIKELKSIEMELVEMKEFKQIEELQKFLKDNKVSSLLEFINNQRLKRNGLLQNLNNQESLQTIIKNEQFQKLVYSLNPESKEVIFTRIKNYITQKLALLEHLYNEDYPRFQETQQEIGNIFLKFQQDSQKLAAEKNLFTQILTKISTQEVNKINAITSNSLEQLLKVALVYQNSKNTNFMHKIAEIISLKPRTSQSYANDQELFSSRYRVRSSFRENKRDIRDNPEDPLLFMVQIQTLKSQISGHNQIIIKAISKLENRVIEKSLKKVKRLFNCIDGNNIESGLRETFIESESKKSQLDKEWANLLSLTCYFEKFEVNGPVFEENTVQFVKFTKKMASLYINLKEEGQQIYAKLQTILYNPLQYQSIDKFFHKAIKYEENLSPIYQSVLEIRDVAISSIKDWGRKIKEMKEKLIQETENLQAHEFKITVEEQIEFDEELERSKIIQFQKKMKFLSKLRMPCNEYFGCCFERTADQKKKKIESELSNFEGLFQVQIDQCRHFPERSFDKRIIFNYKLIQLLSSKVYEFLPNFLPLFEYCSSLIPTQIDCSQSCIKDCMEKIDQQKADKLINQLVFLQKILQIPEFHEKILGVIKQQFKKIRENSKKFRIIKARMLPRKENFYINKLYEQFCEDNILIPENFDESASMLNQMIKNKTITKDQQTILKESVEDFYHQFKIYEQKVIENGEGYNQIASDVKYLGQEAKKKLETNSHKLQIADRIKLLAKIWILLSYLQCDKKNQQICGKVQLPRPHSNQIICALLLIGCETPNIKQILGRNRLCSVKTGEGKSNIIGVVAVYLALSGYQVHCSCYSKLQAQYYEKYNRFFQACGVHKMIIFGTVKQNIANLLSQRSMHSDSRQSFSSVIKKMIELDGQYFNKTKGDIFSKFQHLFGSNQPHLKAKEKTILMIDQIESLFDPQPYADSFSGEFSLKNNYLHTLIEFIWKNRNERALDYEMVINSQEFKNVISSYKNTKQILENQIYGMLQALTTYQNQQYEIYNETIYYKPCSGEFSLKHIGFCTVFVYLHEFEKGKVSNKAKNQNMRINLKLGEFSYACLVQGYDHILGVTGDSSKIPIPVKAELSQRFKIQPNEIYQIPPIYKDNCDILRPIITEKSKHHSELAKNIIEHYQRHQPVLVFFKNRQDLNDFYNSNELRQLKTHDSSPVKNKTHLIFPETQSLSFHLEYSSSNRITLMTSEFIRGTDFNINKKKVNQTGGYHTIIAYLIRSPDDYRQAIGRVSRHENKSTFIEIFCEEELTKIGLQNSGRDPATIQKRRREQYETEISESLEKLKNFQKIHKKTINFYKDKNLSQQGLIQHILQENYCKQIDLKALQKIRIMLIIDATADPEKLLKNLSTTLPDIQKQANKILQPLNCLLQLQIVLIRNYNYELQNLLQYSIFDGYGKELQQFLKKKTVSREYTGAIEVGLQYANSISNLNEIILIGGSRIKYLSSIQHQRNKRSEAQRRRLEKGMIPTCCDDQVTKLARKGIRIHTFYTNGSLRTEYEKMSQDTNGECNHIEYSNLNKIQSLIINKVTLTYVHGTTPVTSRASLL